MPPAILTVSLGLFSAAFLSTATLIVLARLVSSKEERKTSRVSLSGSVLQVAALLTLYWGSLNHSLPLNATEGFAATVALGFVLGIGSFLLVKRKMDLIARDRQVPEP